MRWLFLPVFTRKPWRGAFTPIWRQGSFGASTVGHDAVGADHELCDGDVLKIHAKS